MALREFFTHEGVPLGKKADTKEKLLLQAIELMKTHPNHYTRLKVRFDNAVKVSPIHCDILVRNSLFPRRTRHSCKNCRRP